MKKKKATTKKIVPVEQKSKKVVIPKPTRTEVVEALVAAEVRNLLAKRTAIQDKMKAVHDEIAAVVRKYCEDNKEKIFGLLTSSLYIHNGDVSLSAVRLASSELGITNKTTEYKNLDLSGREIYINPDVIRRRMRSAIVCDPARVKVLSESNEIGEMLAHIHGYKQLQNEIHNNDD